MLSASAKIDKLLRQAVLAHGSGETDRAERLFRQAAGMKPLEPRAAYNLGVFLRQSTGDARLPPDR